MRDNNGKNFFCISGPLRTYKNETFDYNLFESIIDVDFENRKFMAPACYDKFLTQFYGDYMTPLPEEQRGCKIHGEIVDLEHSYKDYIGIQSTLEFKEYTRSIR